MIDTTFRSINRLFVQSFRAVENDPTRNYFLKYYMPVVIGNKPFFDEPVKTNDSYEKLVKCQKNSEYTPGNLLDY